MPHVLASWSMLAKVLALLARFQTPLAAVMLVPLILDAFLRLNGSETGLGWNAHALEAFAFGAGMMGVRRPGDLAGRLAGVAQGAITQARTDLEANLGRTMFEAYRTHALASAHPNEIMVLPPWEDLSEAVRASWEAASKAVRS